MANYKLKWEHAFNVENTLEVIEKNIVLYARYLKEERAAQEVIQEASR